ncbi:MAG: MBL fold metallo-hydrolase, partial [Candidatus Komeilibacteria bacterium]|nr:MBL fold metallo-hydrolase [Candidatus Komeilibacteria bacterium]
GEYEVKNVFIYGIASFHDNENGKKMGKNIIYRLTTESLNLAHLGDLGHELTDEQLEKLGSIDILMIPIGGTYTLDAKMAAKVITQIEPRIVIPMHYQIPGLKTELKGVEEFLKTCGLASETMDKLKISPKELPAEETKVIILTV